MSDDMVERVARALGAADKWRRTDDSPDYRAHLPAWVDYEADARAAIEAMRTPTQDMWVALGADIEWEVFPGYWSRAIDAALSPPPFP